jgi:hypothetical protein
MVPHGVSFLAAPDLNGNVPGNVSRQYDIRMTRESNVVEVDCKRGDARRKELV